MEARAIFREKLVLLYRYTAAAIVGWILLVVASFIWNVHQGEKSINSMAISEASSSFKRDEAIRLFIASRGGVYVPLDDKTPPNPHLHHPEREITTTSGKKFTLMNGGYFLHKVMQEYGNVTHVKWRLTSLKPLNPANTPDEWEQKTLTAMEQEGKEIVGFYDIKGEPYLRLLSPLVTKESCLKCHAGQGYKVGEIRGAMGVSLPMAPYLMQQSQVTRDLIWTHVFFLLSGLVGIGFASTRIRKRFLDNIRVEEELELRRYQLEELVKELEQFAYVASHDLREPLRKISNFADLLGKRYSGQIDEKADKYIHYIVDGCQRLDHLIEDLLKYSRATREKLETQPTSVENLLNTTLSDLRPLLQENDAEITHDNLPSLQINGTQIGQVFQNLIQNAVKFRAEKPPRIHVTAQRKGSEWIFSVQDNGIGIDPQHADKVFQIFQRLHTRSEYPGTGIGLAVCKKIVERHGGRIWLESEPGKGATFYFTLPLMT